MIHTTGYRSLSGVAATLLLSLLPGSAYAQDVIDAFMRGSGATDAAISLSSESYDKMWMGDTEVPLPAPLGTISTTSINLYVAHGITADIDLVAAVSHVSASAAGDGTGPPDQSGVQDGLLMLKWRPLQGSLGKSVTVDFVTAAGVRGPLTNYVSDAPVAIGHRSTDVELRAIGLFRHTSGIFASLSLGYSRRDGVIPDAAVSGASLGIATQAVFAEAWIHNQIGQDGTDIGDMIAFPTNRISYLRAGVRGSYGVTPWLGISVGAWTTLDGRNIGKTTALNGGIVLSLDRLSYAISGK